MLCRDGAQNALGINKGFSVYPDLTSLRKQHLKWSQENNNIQCLEKKVQGLQRKLEAGEAVIFKRKIVMKNLTYFDDAVCKANSACCSIP